MRPAGRPSSAPDPTCRASWCRPRASSGAGRHPLRRSLLEPDGLSRAAPHRELDLGAKVRGGMLGEHAGEVVVADLEDLRSEPLTHGVALAEGGIDDHAHGSPPVRRSAIAYSVARGVAPGRVSGSPHPTRRGARGDPACGRAWPSRAPPPGTRRGGVPWTPVLQER